jgi:putative flippase GtrA
MTTDALAWLDERVPRGTLVRFSIAGGFNSAIFFLCWAILLAAFSTTDVRILWGLCWGATGVLAHYVHRWFTFDNRKPVSWTLSTALPVYFISLVGSSVTIGWLAETFPEDVRLLGILNLLAWGVIVWLMMRFWVFQYASTAHASPTHQEE